MNSFAHKREQILQQMDQIRTMERGSLQEETRPSKQGPTHPNGPYFKHQVWEKGKNKTRRVPREEAEHLASAIRGRQRFEALAEQFVEISVAMTREQSDEAAAKKNARNSKRLSSRRPED
jgi:hypothetical protein